MLGCLQADEQGCFVFGQGFFLLALSNANKLLQLAMSNDRRLTAPERRHVIHFLMATKPDMTNSEMGELFGVSERQIRLDKANIREAKAKFLKDEVSKDISLVIADIAIDFERQAQDLEKSKAKAKLGSTQYVQHCNAILDMRLKTVKAFQDIGFLPKNLGAMTVEKFEYKAVVNKDGSVNTRSVEMFDDAEVAKRAAIDAEFEEVPRPALPAAPDEQNSETTTPESEAVENSDAGNKVDSGSSGIATSAPEAA